MQDLLPSTLVVESNQFRSQHIDPVLLPRNLFSMLQMTIFLDVVPKVDTYTSTPSQH